MRIYMCGFECAMCPCVAAKHVNVMTACGHDAEENTKFQMAWSVLVFLQQWRAMRGVCTQHAVVVLSVQSCPSMPGGKIC